MTFQPLRSLPDLSFPCIVTWFFCRKSHIFFLDNGIIILTRELQNKAEVNVEFKMGKCCAMQVVRVESPRNGLGNLSNSVYLMSLVGMVIAWSLPLNSVSSKERKLQCSLIWGTSVIFTYFTKKVLVQDDSLLELLKKSQTCFENILTKC